MRLSEALEKIHVPMGTTSLLAGVMGGDLDSISNKDASFQTTLTEAEGKVDSIEFAQENARSDASWWGYQSQLSYWRTVVYLLKAAKIAGAENLPDIEPPNFEGMMVMTACAEMEKWGKHIMLAAGEV